MKDQATAFEPTLGHRPQILHLRAAGKSIVMAIVNLDSRFPEPRTVPAESVANERIVAN